MNIRVAEPARPDAPAAEELSLFRGGLLHSVFVRLGLVGQGRPLVRIGLALAVLTWVPLALLSLLQWDGPESTVTFWKSIGTHVRLLFTIPLFFFAEDAFDTRAGEALKHIVQNGLILPQDKDRFDTAKRKAVRARDSWWIEAGIFVLTVALLWFGFRQDLLPGVTTWRTVSGHPSVAGWWYSVVCLSLFQFLVWRWCWHLMVWSLLLWRLSRLNLQLIPTHPDRAGGLAVLGVAHVDLAPLATGAAAILSSSYAEQILFAGAPPASFAVPFTAAVIGTTLALVLPLTFFTRKLIDTKQVALLEYGTVAADYSRAFAAKWLHADRQHDEHFLGAADIQSMADMGGTFELVRNMTIVPIDRFQILLLLAASAVPFAPLLFLAFPLDELILDSMRSVLSLG